MSKTIIQTLVKESLRGIFEKAKSTPKKSDKKSDKKDDDKDEKNDTPLDSRDQNSIQQRLKDDLAPSMADVCKASGILPKADTNGSQRSQCRKKLLQKDGQGLNNKEKDAIEKTLKIK